MVKTLVGGGEVSDYFERSMQQCFRGLYLECTDVDHKFQIDRINFKYLLKYGLAKGRLRDDSRTKGGEAIL